MLQKAKGAQFASQFPDKPPHSVHATHTLHCLVLMRYLLAKSDQIKPASSHSILSLCLISSVHVSLFPKRSAPCRSQFPCTKKSIAKHSVPRIPHSFSIRNRTEEGRCLPRETAWPSNLTRFDHGTKVIGYVCRCEKIGTPQGVPLLRDLLRQRGAETDKLSHKIRTGPWQLVFDRQAGVGIASARIWWMVSQMVGTVAPNSSVKPCFFAATANTRPQNMSVT